MKRPMTYAIYMIISIVPVIMAVLMAYGVAKFCELNAYHSNSIIIIAVIFASIYAVGMFMDFHKKDKEARQRLTE